MAPQRTRREIAAALRRSPAPAPVDEAFIGVLAGVASTSTAAAPRPTRSRLGLRVAAVISAFGMITVGSAYAAHQLGQHPGPAPVVPTSETHAPDGSVAGPEDSHEPTTTDVGDRSHREGSRTDGGHPAHDGDDGATVSDADETQDESAGNTATDDSSGPKIEPGPGQDDPGDPDQGVPEAHDQEDQDDNAQDTSADADENQQVQRPGDGNREPEDGEVAGDDEN